MSAVGREPADLGLRVEKADRLVGVVRSSSIEVEAAYAGRSRAHGWWRREQCMKVEWQLRRVMDAKQTAEERRQSVGWSLLVTELRRGAWHKTRRRAHDAVAGLRINADGHHGVTARLDMHVILVRKVICWSRTVRYLDSVQRRCSDTAQKAGTGGIGRGNRRPVSRYHA